jgi:hypothetical protein
MDIRSPTPVLADGARECRGRTLSFCLSQAFTRSLTLEGLSEYGGRKQQWSGAELHL